MADLSWFNPAENEAPEFGPLPAGKYVAVITSSEMKPTKDGSGAYLELKFLIMDGPYRNRNIWSRLNIKNKSEAASKIALGQLSAICNAVGCPNPQESTQLHDIPLELTVIQRKGQDGLMQNDIRGYGKMNGQLPHVDMPSGEIPF